MTSKVPTPEAASLLTVIPEKLIEGCRADLARAREAISRVKTGSGRTLEATLEPYDTAVGLLGDAAARASVCRNAHPDRAMRDAADRCEQEVDALQTELSLDRGLYDALCALDASKADPATRHYLEKTLRDFRRAGVDRDEATRTQVRALREELLQIGQAFSRNIMEDVRTLELAPAELAGMPEDFVRTHSPGPNGKVRLTTDNTDYVPFMTYARSASAREAFWRLYRLRGHPQNLEVLQKMLERRHALATLLGYRSWADYVTEDKMIATADKAVSFVGQVTTASQARMAADYQALLERKRNDDPSAEKVDPWDTAWLTERIKAERYQVDAQAARPYFEYGRVKQGVLDVTARLFGIRYRAVKGAPVWHPDVEAWDVLDAGGDRLLGRIYLDMFPREGKYKHYAQFTLVNGKAGQRLPEGALICNFQRPSGDAATPALLEHGDVKTFFHEFGHLLHHVLGGHTRWTGISGVATEWDFVEAPSQLLEEWVWDPETLRSFARHHRTGEPIPTEWVTRMREADDFGKGLWVRQQMFYAALSLDYHGGDPRGLDTTRRMAELQEKYTPFRHVDGTFFHASFGHLEGYSAIYYTYMWSLVIAKDLFTAFGGTRPLLDPEPALRYRQKILEAGGGAPAARLVEDFLGRPYNVKAYERWLNA
jgi:thimet oligopeptidase